MNILAMILLLIGGGCIGSAITLAFLNKSVDEMVEAYDGLIITYENIRFLDDKIIAGKDKIIQDTYSYLVNLRDHDKGDLDEIIGVLGENLDDHKEETSNESDSD